MRYLNLAATSVALSTTGLAAAVAYAAGGYALSATNSGDGLAHKITFLNKTATDHSAKTLTIVGTDADGLAMTETHAAPAGSVAITFVNHYLTVTSITISSTTGADTFDIGWTADSVTPSFAIDQTNDLTPVVECFAAVPAGTSPTFGWDFSADSLATSQVDTSWVALTTGKTSTDSAQVTFPILRLRGHFTAAGLVNFTALETQNRR